MKKRRVGYVTRKAEIINAYKNLVGKLKGWDHLQWEDDITVGIKVTDEDGADWTHLAQVSIQLAPVNTVTTFMFH